MSNRTSAKPKMWSTSLKRTFLSFSISLILILAVHDIRFGTVFAARALSPNRSVEINKCCHIGEILNRDKKCITIEGGADDHWWPPIYLVNKLIYFPRLGEAPKHLRITEYKQPNCANPELFLNSFALFSNGSLFLGERNLFIDVDNFCIDKDVAIVCLPTNAADSLTTAIKLTKIRKCCSLNSIYQTDNQTCAPHSTEQPPKLFATKNTSSIDLVYGFPRCSEATNNKYVIVDQFHENNLNIDDGTYTLENPKRILIKEQFCIDHTNQNAKSVIGTVIACDELVDIKETLESEKEKVCSVNNRI